MRRAQGFTLIELLVVLVIIGCLVSVAVLATGNPSSGRQLREEADRLAALMTLLVDEAVLEGREYGLLLDADSYQVLVHDNLSETWSRDSSRTRHAMPGWMRMELKLDGEALVLPALATPEDSPGGTNRSSDEEPLAPQLLFLSSGELSPFTLRLEERERAGSAYTLASDGYQLPRPEATQ